MAKLKFEMKERVGKGSRTIWYLKYRISEALEITLTKWHNNYPTHNQLAKFVKGIERTQVFWELGKRMWNDSWQENSFWVSGWGRNSKSVEWKQVVAREKTKFEMKILWGKRKVKWAKRREGQNMWTEIHSSIKSSDIIYKLAGQEMNVIKLCRKENIANHEGDHSGFHLSSLSYFPLFFPFWICLW